jgi:hypothetical protein
MMLTGSEGDLMQSHRSRTSAAFACPAGASTFANGFEFETTDGTGDDGGLGGGGAGPVEVCSSTPTCRGMPPPAV